MPVYLIIESEVKDIETQANKLIRAVRDLAAARSSDDKIAKLVAEAQRDASRRDDLRLVLKADIRKLRLKRKQLLAEIKFKATTHTVEVIAAAGKRPESQRSVVLAVSPRELVTIICALDSYGQMLSIGNGRAVEPAQCDAMIERGDLAAYLVKCSMLCNAMHRIDAGVVKRGARGEWAEETLPWPAPDEVEQ